MRKETSSRHIGYSFRLAARVLLYAPSHRQDSTYHGLCYTSRGALAGARNSSMGPPHEGSIRQPIAPSMSERSYHGVTSRSLSRKIKPKDKYVCISMKEIWRNLDGPPKDKELRSYVVSFEFSRLKVDPALTALQTSYCLCCQPRVMKDRICSVRFETTI